MSRQLALRQIAAQDAEAATRYYAAEGGTPLALDFAEALARVYTTILDNPGVGSPRFSELVDVKGLRSCRLKRFPYVVLYVERPDCVEVWRVLHARRDIPAAFSDLS